MSRNLAKLEEWGDTVLWKGISRTERAILINYKQALDEIRHELGKVYEKYAINGMLTHAEMSKYHRLKSLHDQLAGIMGPTLSKNGKLVEKLQEVQYEESFYLHAWALDQTSGAALRWGLLNEAAVKRAVEAGGWRELHDIAIKDLKRDGLAKIDRAVTQGIIRGLPYEKMAKEVKGAITANSARATLIARTEGHRAMVQGALDNYAKAQELGIDIKLVWDATLDDKTRPSHAEMDGKSADEDGMFHTSWGLVSGPGQEGPPEEVINCRCRVTSQIEGYGPKARRVRDEGVIPYTTFKDWAQERGITKNVYGEAYR